MPNCRKVQNGNYEQYKNY